MNAAEMILRWCDLYTRGLSPAVAGDRRAELASDLWEHAAVEPRATGAMLSRALRGVPADLAWRHAEHRRVRALLPRSQRIVSGGITALVLAAASALIVLGLVAISRTAFYVSQGYVRPWSETAVWVSCFTALAIAGALLLLRSRTRWLGAVALAASTPLVHFALYDLYNKSATIVALSNTSTWSIAIVCLMAFTALVFTAAAVLWMPTRKAAQ